MHGVKCAMLNHKDNTMDDKKASSTQDSQSFTPRRRAAKPLRGVPSSYMAHPNSVFTQQSFSGAAASHKSHKRLLTVLIAAIVVTIAGVASALLWQQRQNDSPQRMVQSAVESALGATSYRQVGVVEGTSLSYTADADLTDAKNPKISVPDLKLNSGTTVSLRFIGHKVYAKQHFSDDVLNKGADKQKAAALQDVWVVWAQNEKVVTSSYPESLQLPAELLQIGQLLPTAVIMYNIPQADRSSFVSFIIDNQIYVAGSEQPVEEQANGKTVKHVRVAINKPQLAELNKKVIAAVGAMGNDQIDDYVSVLSDTLDVWVDPSSGQLVQYAFDAPTGRRTLAFDRINQQVTVDEPTAGQKEQSSATAVSDAAILNAMNNLGLALEQTNAQNNPYPSNQVELNGLANTLVDQDIAKNFKFTYGTSLPSAPNEIMFSKSARCDATDTNFFTEGVNDATYAIVVKVSSGTSCSDNID